MTSTVDRGAPVRTDPVRARQAHNPFAHIERGDWLDAENAWQLRARCAGFDPDLFFHPDGERGEARALREQAAKAICALCPVVDACLAHALGAPEAAGVWGGLGEAERAARRRGDRARVVLERLDPREGTL